MLEYATKQFPDIVLFDQPMAELYAGPGLLVKTLWRSPAYDTDNTYALVDSRTNTVIGEVYWGQIAGEEMQEGVLYRICPYAC